MRVWMAIVALCLLAAVEADGNIITGNGPEAAEEFARAVGRALAE
jgi:putative intracellular protease/amidase